MNKSTTPVATYIEGAIEALAKISSVRKASEKFSINFMTLQLFCEEPEVGCCLSVISFSLKYQF
jgi:hypothetical protein